MIPDKRNKITAKTSIEQFLKEMWSVGNTLRWLF